MARAEVADGSKATGDARSDATATSSNTGQSPQATEFRSASRDYLDDHTTRHRLHANNARFAAFSVRPFDDTLRSTAVTSHCPGKHADRDAWLPDSEALHSTNHDGDEDETDCVQHNAGEKNSDDPAGHDNYGTAKRSAYVPAYNFSNHDNAEERIFSRANFISNNDSTEVRTPDNTLVAIYADADAEASDGALEYAGAKVRLFVVFKSAVSSIVADSIV